MKEMKEERIREKKRKGKRENEITGAFYLINDFAMPSVFLECREKKKPLNNIFASAECEKFLLCESERGIY